MSDSPLRVCILLPAHWSSIPGGAELQVRYLVQTLVRRAEVEVFYVCRHAATGTSDGASVIPVPAGNYLSRYLYAPDYRRILAVLHDVRPDVIYCRVASAYVGMAARYCRSRKCRLVWHIALESDVRPYVIGSRRALVRFTDRLLFEYGVRRADAIIGQAGYQDALLAATFQRHCAAVVPNFHPDPEPAAKPRHVVRIVWIASIKPLKRPEAFIELARRLRHREDLEFVMIGPVQDDGWESRLPRELADLPHLTYLGALSMDDANAELARAHLFVNTSLLEGFPNTFVQAWLRRTVVLSLSVDPDALLSSGGLGRLSGNVDGLVTDVVSLAGDHEARGRLAETSFHYAQQRHSMTNAEALADMILTLGRAQHVTAGA